MNKLFVLFFALILLGGGVWFFVMSSGSVSSADHITDRPPTHFERRDEPTATKIKTHGTDQQEIMGNEFSQSQDE